MSIAYEKFIHPEDRAALEKLKAIPLLDTVVRQYLKFIRDSDKSSFLQNWMIKDLDHPYPAIRAAEVVKWFKCEANGVTQKCVTNDIGSATLNW